MKIAIIGAGYVGLVTGAGLASKGHEVILTDHDPVIIEKISGGHCPIYEPGLPELLKNGISTGALTATTETAETVAQAEVTFITVGTPLKEGAIDLSHIKEACVAIGQGLRVRQNHHVVAVKSTVIPKTTDTVVLPILEEVSKKKAGRDWGLCTNPEFMREGTGVSDFLRPDRIILGCYDEATYLVMSQVYLPFSQVPIVRTNLRTAEMIKYTANALFPTLISFANEIASITERVAEIDVLEVLRNVFLDQRFQCDGSQALPGCVSYLRPGCGFGGSCFPKDLGALISFAQEHGYESPLLKSVLAINEFRKRVVIDTLSSILGTLKGKKIAMLGLSFKPGTDDVRESPALDLIKYLLQQEAEVAAFDPVAVDNAEKCLPRGRVKFTSRIEDSLSGAEACVVHTEWPLFTVLTPENFNTLMKYPLLLDTRRIYDKDRFRGKVQYKGTGLGPDK